MHRRVQTCVQVCTQVNAGVGGARPRSPGASACLTLGFCSLRSSVGGLLTSYDHLPRKRTGVFPNSATPQSLPAQADVLHCHLVVSSGSAGTCQPAQDGPNTPVAATGPGCRLSGGPCPEPCPQVHVLVSHRAQELAWPRCLISQLPLPSAPSSSGHYYSGAIGKSLETEEGQAPLG